MVRIQRNAPNAASPGMPILECMATADLNDVSIELERIRMVIDI